MHLTREIRLPATTDEVWESLSQPEWLGEDAHIDLRPDGDVRVGDRTGFVEEAEEPARLVFWWSEPDEDATRVELDLEADGEETIVRVVESAPLAMLDLYGVEFVQAAPRPQQPELAAH
jgi:uncharacterized protein YndB with AHSA1/START domain